MANKAIYESEEGWTILYYQQNINATTRAVIGFKCGADMDGKLKGIAHLLEHMLFNDNSTYKKENVYDFLNYTNTLYNAYTSHDCIQLDFDFTNSNVNDVFKIMSRILLKKEFTQEELDRERQVVIHEIHQATAEDPHSTTIVGTEETLNMITPQDLTDFANKYFVKENLVMSIVSSLDYNVILEQLYKNFISKIPSKPENKVIIKQDPDFFTKPKYYEKIPESKNFIVEYVFKGPQNKEKFEIFDKFESVIFNDILRKEFREKNPLTYSPYFYSFQNGQTKMKIFQISTSPDKAMETIKTLNAVLDNLITNGISNRQMFKFKANLFAERERKANTKTRDAERMFTDYINGDPVFVNNFYKKVGSLTKQEINEYIKNTYGLAKMFICFVGDLLEASNLLKASRELEKLEEKIKYMPYTVPDEVCEKMYAEEFCKILSQPVYLPTTHQILKEFRLDKKILYHNANRITFVMDEKFIDRIINAQKKWKKAKIKAKIDKTQLENLIKKSKKENCEQEIMQ